MKQTNLHCKMLNVIGNWQNEICLKKSAFKKLYDYDEDNSTIEIWISIKEKGIFILKDVVEVRE